MEAYMLLRNKTLEQEGQRELFQLPPMKTIDAVNHPPHYTQSDIEPIDVIESWGLGFHLGNALKYIARCDHKGRPVEDLEKARWYLDREIARRKAANG